MKEIIAEILQGSDEWHNCRLGSIGGTGITTVVSNGGGRKKYMYELASEIITGVKIKDFKFQYADRGHEFEPVARNFYGFVNDVSVEQFAMIKDGPHKHHSPDGIVGDSGMIEIKVRLPHVFIEIMEESPSMATGERRQVQWGLHLWEKEWCDYIQFCPEIEDDPMLVKRIYRNEKEINELESGANIFIEEMLEIVNRRTKR